MRSKIMLGGFGLLFWHLAMNTGVFLEGWYGSGLSSWVSCQVAGIPFLLDHLLKLVLLVGLYESVSTDTTPTVPALVGWRAV